MRTEKGLKGAARCAGYGEAREEIYGREEIRGAQKSPNRMKSEKHIFELELNERSTFRFRGATRSRPFKRMKRKGIINFAKNGIRH